MKGNVKFFNQKQRERKTPIKLKHIKREDETSNLFLKGCT